MLPMYAHPGKFEGELDISQCVYDWEMNGSGEYTGDEGNIIVRHEGPFDVKDFDEKCLGRALTQEERDFVDTLTAIETHESDQGFYCVDWRTA